MANNNKISTYVLLFLVGIAIIMLLSRSDSFKNANNNTVNEEFVDTNKQLNTQYSNQQMNSPYSNQQMNSPYSNQQMNSPYSNQQNSSMYDNNATFISQPANGNNINLYDKSSSLNNQNSMGQNSMNQYSVEQDSMDQNNMDQNNMDQNNMDQNNMNQNNMNQNNMSQNNMSQNNMNQNNMNQNNMSQNNNDPYIPQSLINNIASQSYQNSSNGTPDQQMYSSQKKSSNQGISNFDFTPNDESIFDFDGSSLADAFAPPIPPGTNTETVDFKKQNMENYNAKDFLPKEVNDEWFETDFSLAKYQLNDDKLINTDRYIIGINTVGQSLKNATYDIRGTVPNPKFIVSPWNNSTFEPDFNLKPLC
jgi:hypothetical protein